MKARTTVPPPVDLAICSTGNVGNVVDIRVVGTVVVGSVVVVGMVVVVGANVVGTENIRSWLIKYQKNSSSTRLHGKRTVIIQTSIKEDKIIQKKQTHMRQNTYKYVKVAFE